MLLWKEGDIASVVGIQSLVSWLWLILRSLLEMQGYLILGSYYRQHDKQTTEFPFVDLTDSLAHYLDLFFFFYFFS